MSASQYERELKNILEGETKTLEMITKSCNVLEKENFTVLANTQVPANDGGISLGQALVAAAVAGK